MGDKENTWTEGGDTVRNIPTSPQADLTSPPQREVKPWLSEQTPLLSHDAF